MEHRVLLGLVAKYLSLEASTMLERLIRSAWDVDYVLGGLVAYLIVYYDRGSRCRPVMLSRDGSVRVLDYLAIATVRGSARRIHVSECVEGEPRYYSVGYGAWSLCDKPGYTGSVLTRDFRRCVSGGVKPVRRLRA